MTLPAASTAATADPEPWRRCRCVATHREDTLDDYRDRCPEPCTQEDGMCDHCRTTGPCGCPGVCCHHTAAQRRTVPAATPCAAPQAWERPAASTPKRPAELPVTKRKTTTTPDQEGG